MLLDRMGAGDCPAGSRPPALIIISVHGDQRCRERLGLPRRAVRRMVERAWACGAVVRERAGVVRGDTEMRRFGAHDFVFDRRGGEIVFVTVVSAKLIEDERDGVRAQARHIARVVERRAHMRRRQRRS